MSSVSLNNPIVVQEEVTSSSVEILEVVENYVDKTVVVKVKTSDNPISFEYVRLWNADNYDIDWTQEDLEEAIVEYYNPTETVESNVSSTDDTGA